MFCRSHCSGQKSTQYALGVEFPMELTHASLETFVVLGMFFDEFND